MNTSLKPGTTLYVGTAIDTIWSQIYYHVWWPGQGNDPMYLMNQSMNCSVLPGFNMILFGVITIELTTDLSDFSSSQDQEIRKANSIIMTNLFIGYSYKEYKST